jgi:hypothetical protein
MTSVKTDKVWLVAVDGTPNSTRAFRLAKALFRQNDKVWISGRQRPGCRVPGYQLPQLRTVCIYPPFTLLYTPRQVIVLCVTELGTDVYHTGHVPEVCTLL